MYLGVYWPLVAALTLAVLAALKSYGGDERHAPLPAAQVSNELARAVSYGLVGAEPKQASSVQPGPAVELPRAS
ncbi:hypothetical protein Busp01_13210 [Trinickia caryophylli]|nr:hypothetical protein Busp01_13210 [Trinickia caryophylli]